MSIIGSFVFRNEGDGCLTSKYLNSGSGHSPLTECCKATKSDPMDRFVGDYVTVWLENGGKTVSAELSIKKNAAGTYDLRWQNGRNTIFKGSGMLFENVLVGAYWD